MAKMRYHISVSPMVTQGLLVLGLVLLVGLWFVGSNRTEKTFTDDIGLRLIASSNVIATRIADWDDTNIRVLNQVVRLPDMASMEGPRQVPLLKSISDSYDWIFLALTTTPTGENVARNDGQPLRPYDDRAWFQSVIGGAPFARQLLISKTTGKPALVLARPIRDGAGRLIGVVCISMFLSEISKAISTAKIGQTGYAVLLDEKNMVIAHGNPANVRAALEDFGDHPALAAVGAGARPAVYSLADKKIVAFARKLPQGWTLLVEQDYNEAFSPLEVVAANARALMLISVALFLAIGYFYNRGKIAYLGEKAARESARAEAVKRQAMQAQLQLLQAQIEPHMMFNTLANLKSLIRFEPAEAGRMLDLFIVYLRATLSSSRAETTTLAHEFALLKAYLGLMQVRMADRLHFALDLPAALSELVVPPMLLQPLVENAIVHGLEAKLEGGRIDVIARCDGGLLTLTVADNGLGLDRPDAEPGARLALGNIRARLASLYGDSASLTLTPRQPHGVLACIVLPLIPAKATKSA